MSKIWIQKAKHRFFFPLPPSGCRVHMPAQCPCTWQLWAHSSWGQGRSIYSTNEIQQQEIHLETMTTHKRMICSLQGNETRFHPLISCNHITSVIQSRNERQMTAPLSCCSSYGDDNTDSSWNLMDRLPRIKRIGNKTNSFFSSSFFIGLRHGCEYFVIWALFSVGEYDYAKIWVSYNSY